VVLADDEEDIRLLLDVAFGLVDGVNVVGQFPDAASMIAAAPRLRPDIVVLDLSMPGMSGLDAIPHLRAAAPACRIVVYSASDRPEVARAVLDAGADAYFAKTTTHVSDVVAAVVGLGEDRP
jgi:DNA-binding NarL/FixJ family response regulator